MKTGKLIVNPIPTHYTSNHDENSYIPVTFLKNTGRTGGKLRPQDKSSTRLQKLSLMNNTYFGTIHYDIHLDMKLHNTFGRIFQEMSLSELETQTFQSFVLAVLKTPFAEYFLSGNRSNFIEYGATFFGILPPHVDLKIATMLYT